MNTKKLALVGAVVSAIAGFVAAPAQATIITNWNWTVNSGFSAFAPSGASAVQGSNNNAVLGLPSVLSWPANDGVQSSLTFGGVNGAASGSIVTNAAPINTVVVVHDNNPINGTSLSTATLQDRLTLDPELPLGAGNAGATAGPSDAFSLPDLFFNINFVETTNSTPCVAPSPAGNPCNDIFVLSLAGPGAFLNNAGTPFLAQDFTYEGQNYGINLFMNGLTFLSNSICAAAGAANGCVGFTTIENQTNNLQVQLQIVADPVRVPEPITLSLFGAGLAGAAAFGRRKMKKSA
jgi:hypothetical protein